MIARRTLLTTVGAVALAGCLSDTENPPQSAADDRTDDPDSGGLTDADRSELPDVIKPTDPESAVRQFYAALFAEDHSALNELVHSASPIYPLEPRHVPPERFEQFDRITIADVETVSVQDWVVQRLYPNVTRTTRTRKAMGVDRMQYVHTTFYLTREGDDQVYEAETVDYLVEDDGRWYVRYDG